MFVGGGGGGGIVSVQQQSPPETAEDVLRRMLPNALFAPFIDATGIVALEPAVYDLLRSEFVRSLEDLLRRSLLNSQSLRRQRSFMVKRSFTSSPFAFAAVGGEVRGDMEKRYGGWIHSADVQRALSMSNALSGASRGPVVVFGYGICGLRHVWTPSLHRLLRWMSPQYRLSTQADAVLNDILTHLLQRTLQLATQAGPAKETFSEDDDRYDTEQCSEEGKMKSRCSACSWSVFLMFVLPSHSPQHFCDD